VDAFATLQDYLACDAQYLPYLAQKIGWSLDTASPAALQRKMVGLLVPMYRERGTTQGIVDILNLLLGLAVTIHEPWADGWRVGTSELSNGALSPAPPVMPYSSPLPYTFYVLFPRALTSAERAAAGSLIEFAKRAETHAVIVEPRLVTTPWVLGQTRIGTITAQGAGAQLVRGQRVAPAPLGNWSEDTFAQYAGGTLVLSVAAGSSETIGPLVPGARYQVEASSAVYLRQGNRSVVAGTDDFVLEPDTEWFLTPGRASALYLAARLIDSQAAAELRLSRVDTDFEFPAGLRSG
jgi:phage tail-like protein